jgi:hypothetical protein
MLKIKNKKNYFNIFLSKKHFKPPPSLQPQIDLVKNLNGEINFANFCILFLYGN